jgi:hypothetical protein
LRQWWWWRWFFQLLHLITVMSILNKYLHTRVGTSNIFAHNSAKCFQVLWSCDQDNINESRNSCNFMSLHKRRSYLVPFVNNIQLEASSVDVYRVSCDIFLLTKWESIVFSLWHIAVGCGVSRN